MKCVIENEKLIKQIERVLKEERIASIWDLANRLRMNYYKVLLLLSELEKDGKIERKEVGGRKVVIYNLPAQIENK